jgi:uncharacterized protein involved in exopolysaccharide biosynthesis
MVFFDYFFSASKATVDFIFNVCVGHYFGCIGAYKKPEPIPQYQATTTLVVKPDMPALVNIKGAQPFYQQYFDESVDQRTQLQILTSGLFWNV